MHIGREYPTAFRRDYPTGQPYPNLWPDRLTMSFVSAFVFPTGRLLDIVGEPIISEPGDIESGVMVYRVISDDGLFTATFTFSTEILEDDHHCHYRFLWEDTGVPGLLQVDFTGYGIVGPSDAWGFNLVAPIGLCTIVQTGAYAGMTVGLPNFVIRMDNVNWIDNPTGWWDS